MKTIFLVNSISGRGHLDAYARLYSRALVELGCRVVLIAESDGGTTGYLARSKPDLLHLFSYLSFDELQRWNPSVRRSPRSSMNPLQRAQIVWSENGAAGLLNRCVTVPARFLSPLIPPAVRRQLGRVKNGVIRGVLRTRLAKYFSFARYLDAGRISFRPLLGYVEKAATMPRSGAPDLVFYLYLDLMAERDPDIKALDDVGARPWVGILFHPRLAGDSGARLEGYFKSDNARGGIFLVPSAIPAYVVATPRLTFTLAPDVADLELAAEQPSLARDIRGRANGRTVILQIGSITRHKGITTLLDVIESADPRRFFFALVGEVHWGNFADQKSRIQSFFATPPENALVFPGYLKDEREYNCVVQACDIIYAVYRDFSSSSNSLTKAAGLRRPILVSDRSLMGERVRAFGIGSTAVEGNSSSVLAELSVLASRPRESFNFEGYEQAHSLEKLKSALSDGLCAWLRNPVDSKSNIVPAAVPSSD